MITVFSDNKEIPVNKVTFSDGAITFKLEGLQPNAENICVNVDPSTPASLVMEELELFDDCLYQYLEKHYFDNNVKLILTLPYLPYARCDRIFEEGNPNGLRRFLMRLNELCYDYIQVCDIHNMDAIHSHKEFWESGHLNIIEKPQLQCFKESLPYNFNNDYSVVLAPDKGAVDKAKTIAEYLNVPCMFANKKRDLSTGKLTEMILPDYDFTGKKVLIPDDILDGGNTFISLSEMLVDSGASAVDLYITHMIAAKGLKQFKNSVDKIYVYQTVGDYINKEDIMRFNDGRY